MRFLYFLVFTGLISCTFSSRNNGDRPVARVFNDYLYESEIKKIIPAGSNPKDSSLSAENYINLWIRQKLILRQAEKNLRINEQDFSKQLEEYKNSLIIYQYESKLISQNLDTAVTEKEIQEYYSTHIDKYRLKANIARAIYGKFERGNPVIKKVNRYFQSDLPAAKDSIRNYFVDHAIVHNINEDKWMLFDDLQRLVPIETYNPEGFLKNNRIYHIEDELYHYFVKFVDYRLKESITPLAYERENIRQIIISNRKLAYLVKMREDLFQNALGNNTFEIYTGDNKE